MKSIILFFTLISTLYGIDINKYKNINSFLISEDKTNYKQITYKEYVTKKFKDFSIKIGIDKNTLINKVYYLSIITDKDTLKYTNAPYIIQDHMLIIKLDESIDDTLYLHFSYDKKRRMAFRFNIISSFEYKYILPYEGILYGLAYGIIFSAFLYYLIIFFSTRKKYFLYYSIMQACVLISLIGFAYFSFQSYPERIPQAIIDFFETMTFLFTFLFAKEILNTKKTMPIINQVLNLFILINFLDLFLILIFKYSYLYENMFFFINFLIPALAGLIATYKGDKNAIFYTFGWFVLFMFVFAYEQDMIPLSGIYTIHIAAPLESLILSFALGIMLKNLVIEQNEKEKLLIHKSKLASMGEMIDNIAHQWRQPLMHLGYINMNLELASSNNKFKQEYFIKKLKESNGQIKFMSKTIDDFRDFYKIEKQKHNFLVSNACNLAINIINPTLTKKKISLNLEIQNDSTIKGYENEYAQVILNFLTNAIEAFEIRKIKDPEINITINSKKHISQIMVCDNAGGIKEGYFKEIFNANFSTKKGGSGIGLYMSKVIIQSHFSGDIYLHNTEKGACFTIKI